ncbi:hypothetical protein HAX54_038003 [Datura stramonium]|uniref:Uncharacterized protein n=1 Tax=Datura stramonium TaxID=4076 RepID=A0ABS8SHX8_DATST|nr:hypothetical protein [Datura stramonium]
MSTKGCGSTLGVPSLLAIFDPWLEEATPLPLFTFGAICGGCVALVPVPRARSCAAWPERCPLLFLVEVGFEPIGRLNMSSASPMPTRCKAGRLAPAVASKEWHLAPGLVPIFLSCHAWQCAKMMAPHA